MGRQMATTITVEETAPLARSIHLSRNCTAGSSADESRPKVEKGLERDCAAANPAASDADSAAALTLSCKCSLDERRRAAAAMGLDGAGVQANPALDILASLDGAADVAAVSPLLDHLLEEY